MHPMARPSVLRACAVLAAFAAALAAEAAWPPTLPATLSLSVKETAGVARTAEVVRSGVPLPRSLDIRNTATATSPTKDPKPENNTSSPAGLPGSTVNKPTADLADRLRRNPGRAVTVRASRPEIR